VARTSRAPGAVKLTVTEEKERSSRSSTEGRKRLWKGECGSMRSFRRTSLMGRMFHTPYRIDAARKLFRNSKEKFSSPGAGRGLPSPSWCGRGCVILTVRTTLASQRVTGHESSHPHPGDGPGGAVRPDPVRRLRDQRLVGQPAANEPVAAA